MATERTTATETATERAASSVQHSETTTTTPETEALVAGRGPGRASAVQLLGLQGLAGNRAVASMIRRDQRGGVTTVEAPATEREDGALESDELDDGLVAQRLGEAPPAPPPEAPPELGAIPGQAVESEGGEGEGEEGPPPPPPLIRQMAIEHVANLPEAPEAEVEAGAQVVPKAQQDGREAAAMVEGRPALAQLIENQAANEPAPAPGRLDRFLDAAGSGAAWVGKGIVDGAKYVGSGLWGGVKAVGRGIKSAGSAIWGGMKSLGGSIKNFFSRNSRMDETAVGAKAQSERRAEKVTNLTKSVVSKGSSAVSAGSKLLKVGAATANVIGKVTGAIGIFFSAVQGAFDLKALVSARRQMKSFEIMAKDAEAAGYDKDVVEAVKYAMEQKYAKVVKRALGVASSVLGIVAGAGLLAITLASNPVGWFILAGIAAAGALIGVGVALYKFGRWVKKTYNGDLGVKRNRIASQLRASLERGDDLARQAIVELHLDPEDIASQDPDVAIMMIVEKLKSS